MTPCLSKNVLIFGFKEISQEAANWGPSKDGHNFVVPRPFTSLQSPMGGFSHLPTVKSTTTFPGIHQGSGYLPVPPH